MEEKRKHHNWWIFGIVCVALACIIIIGWFYLSFVRNNLMEQAVYNVLTVSQQQEQALDNFISRERNMIHSIVSNIAKNDSKDIVALQRELANFSEIEAVYSVVNIEEGVFYTNKEPGAFLLNAEQVAEYDQLSGSGVRAPFVGIYTGHQMFGYYECFTFADGTRAVLQEAYEASQISKDFSLSFYNNRGFSVIVNQKGDILMRAGSNGSQKAQTTGQTVKADSILNLIGTGGQGKTDAAEFLKILQERKTGVDFFQGKKKEYAYTYVPMETVDDWIMISLVEKDAIMEDASRIINHSRVALVVILVVLVVLMVIAILVWRSRRRLREKDLEIEYQEQLFNVFSSYLSMNTDDVYLMFEKGKHELDYVSPNVERVLGFSIEEAMQDLKLLSNEKIKVSYQDLMNMRPGESLEPTETERINPKSGEQKWFRETTYCVSVQGKEKIVAYISDRTEERQTQNTLALALNSAEDANKAKSSFLSSVSHDIRTPMNAIMGLVTLLREEARNPEAVMDYAQRIDASSQHLLRLINDVLDMNKIESGTVSLNISDLNLAEIIDELNTIIRPQAKAKQQEFEIYSSVFKHEALLGDKMRINQILINILSNAVKYTQEGGRIEMWVNELPRVLEKYSRVQFIIKDNGQGMSEEYQKIMFDPFTREQNTLTNKVQGTGLGMAITKNLVDLMGGTIHVESKEGEGSAFTVEFELRIKEQEANPKFWDDHGVKKMIVADDEPEICDNIVHIMRETGVTVDYVLEGSKVIDTIRKAREDGEPYDLILLDWKMPDLDGLETARLIRKNYPEKVPILLLTAYDWSDIEAEARDVGISHFMPKPFFMHNFKEAVKKIIGRGKDALHSVNKEEDSIVKDKHVLIVEDIEVNRLVLGKILTTYGATCDIAVDGKEAVEIFERSQPGQYDLILMDVQMPIMNGYDATKAIRASDHPSAKKIPIVAMTANAFADDVRDALEAGMDAHVSKPVVLGQFESTIREVFDTKAEQ